MPLTLRIIVALGLFFGGYGIGTHHANNACVAGQAKAVAAAQVVADTESTRREAIGAAREVAREQIRVVYRTIKEQAHENVQQHPEYNTCGLDPIGLRIWNAANEGSTPVSSESESSVLSPAASGVGQFGGLATESH